MKQRICLHGIDIKSRTQLVSLVKRLLPHAAVKYKVKEKYFSDNDMYKCRVARFSIGNGCRVMCYWGALSVSDAALSVADVVLEFDAGSAAHRTLIERLLHRILAGKLKFVVEEPNFSHRIDQMRGCYEFRGRAAYNKDDARSALVCHLPWQIYGVSKQWSEIVARGAQRPLLRQLRVKLRRLRSSLTLFKPLLAEEEAAYYQNALKHTTNRLSMVREYDVALMICARLHGNDAEESDEAVPQLRKILQKRRDEAASKLMQGVQLNKETLNLALLLLWLNQSAYVDNGRDTERLEHFLRHRFYDWYEKLIALQDKYSDLHNMEEMHKVRIKLKRFRYALQCVPEMPTPQPLLRSLKYLQDMLGTLHDDYVNTGLLDEIMTVHADVPELALEAAMFTGWGRAKSDVALELLPAQWDEFNRLLEDWNEENL